MTEPTSTGGGPGRPYWDATRIILYAATALVAVVLGATLSLLAFGDRGGPRIGGPFELVDHTGRDVDEDLLLGQLNLVLFGYTNCPDFCPIELANLAEAEALLEAEGRDVQILFVSVDPDRDTPERLAEYVPIFSDDALGLTGTAEQVAQAAAQYGAIYAYGPPQEPDGWYAVDHSVLVYAMDDQGRFIATFPHAADPQAIADRLLAVGG